MIVSGQWENLYPLTLLGSKEKIQRLRVKCDIQQLGGYHNLLGLITGEKYWIFASSRFREKS